MAFDKLFCIAFEMLDAQWLVKRASYMEFNVGNSLLTIGFCFPYMQPYQHIFLLLSFSQDVLKATRLQLERELALEDTSTVKDLPAYNLLRR